MGSAGYDLSAEILNAVDANSELNSLKYSIQSGTDHQKLIGAIKSLESLGEIINVSSASTKCWTCTEEGAQLSKDGSHEARLFTWLPKEGLSVDDVKKNFPNANVALGAALKNKWVQKKGSIIVPVVGSITDEVQMSLQAIARGDANTLNSKLLQEFKKRKLIKDSDVTVFTVSKGPQFTTQITKQEAELTKEMIESGKWKTKTFKPFNFRAKGKQDARPGHLHPLMQLRSEFRQIFLEMGFTEMPTNHFVEAAFWNFDALFQPQQHPARDAHDTFYVKNPARAMSVPQDYMQRVKSVHSNGGYGSSGYRYPWSEEEAYKNLLRTHTTGVSARMLYKLAQDGFKPAKYFSIDRVFRNETLDATHLAEFHQIEGVVADYNLGVKHLMGIFAAFFEKIGIKQLRFKAAYNPYTEPSMEIFGFHPGLKKWVEIGNSGVFRPEMLRPMGLPEDVSVLGFGLSLERPAMIMFGSNNIRELVGPRVKMELVYNNAICTVDKFQGSSLQPPPSNTTASPADRLSQRQERLLSDLRSLQSRVMTLAQHMGVPLATTAMEEANTSLSSSALHSLSGCPNTESCTEIVVVADPRRPPHCLPPLLSILATIAPTEVCVHTHSTLAQLPPSLKNFIKTRECSGTASPVIRLRLIWSLAAYGSSSPDTTLGPTAVAVKQGSRNKSIGVVGAGPPVQPPRVVVSPLEATAIAGENNICRYLGRVIELLSLKGSRSPPLLYEGLSQCLISECDAWLDDCQAWLITGSNRGRANFLNKLSNTLGEDEDDRKFLLGKAPSLADVFVWSSLSVLGITGKVAQNVILWKKKCTMLWSEPS